MNVVTMVTLDKETKEKAQVLFKELGLNLSTALNIFLKKAVEEEKIPFEIGKAKYKKEVLKRL